MNGAGCFQVGDNMEGVQLEDGMEIDGCFFSPEVARFALWLYFSINRST